MSTVAEHLAMLEMYRAQGRRGDELFYQQAWLFTQVHWKELIALLPFDEMVAARAEVERMLREQHGERAEEFISKWHEANLEGAE